MFQAEKGANAIPGYTGFIPSQDYDQDLLQIQGNRNHIPNYAGFVPGIKSENLFGKTFGKITLLSSTHEHHRGSDLPADIRYSWICNCLNSTKAKSKRLIAIRETNVEEILISMANQTQKHQQLLYMLFYQKALAYTLSNLTHFEQTNTLPKRSDSKDRQSSLTYEEALQKLK